ncbi:dynein heavy chain 8, axonemal-like [Anopheles albimanus]|uniref:dynein heavy chain 8, axonemal-like n=1 Tax=Anopheles albimanus TaxID=7167 RepID=UPI00163F98F0|nr:dynein heavy chain 8, axonemal-like [Anopheles albimanus]
MADPDPDQHLKRILNVMGVSTRIGNVVQLVKRRRGSPPKITEEQQQQHRLEQSKEARAERLNALGTKHRHVLEVAAIMLDEESDAVVDCVADRIEDVQLLDSIFNADGPKGLLVFYGLRPAPGMDTGRHNPKQKQPSNQVWITDGRDGKMTSVLVGVSRHSNVKPIEMKGLGEELLFTYTPVPEGRSVVYTLFVLLERALKPSIELLRDYGHCSELQQSNFRYGVNRFLAFLQSTEKDITERIRFAVDNQLYKGFLLTEVQVQETAKDRERMKTVERTFHRWLEQIQFALTQGDQIEQAPHQAGPLVELEYWRTVLTRYTSISEFTEQKVFKQFLHCLKLSRCKLVRMWEKLAAVLSAKLIESRDNVRFISAIEHFWDPLYRCEPREATRCIPRLLGVIRQVYRSSSYYNTADRITGLLTKIANQIIINCRLFLTSNGTIRIYEQPKETVIGKIEHCQKLEAAFRREYHRTVQRMLESPGETPWECSEVFVFGKLDHFRLRITKIMEVMDLYRKYEIIDRVAITGTESFSGRIKAAYEVLTTKPYDPLIYTDHRFDEDHRWFLQEVETAELGLAQFLKHLMANERTVEGNLLVLRRFERLQLDCLCVERRFLDVAVLLERFIFTLKDVYSEQRANPPIPQGVPETAGRIMWSRSLLRQIREPFAALRGHRCVIEHQRAQLCVKYYNFLCEVLLHYELIHHEAWTRQAIKTKTATPVYRRQEGNLQLEMNLHPWVKQLIRETEIMLKLGLTVPDPAIALVQRKKQLYRHYEHAKYLLRHSDALRLSIPPIFLPLMRTTLAKLDAAFQPGLTVVTWDSLNIGSYLEQLERTVQRMEHFYKEIYDIWQARVEDTLRSFQSTDLLTLPTEPVSPSGFYDMNLRYRESIQVFLQKRSQAMEGSVVELINKFVSNIEVPDRDEHGARRYQLPLDQINDSNRRQEELLPTDKYDWLRFDRMDKVPTNPTPEAHLEALFQDYGKLNYDVTLLHIDCMELFAYFNSRMLTVFVRMVRSSLENLRARLELVRLQSNKAAILDEIRPLIVTDMLLRRRQPDAACHIEPTLEEIQFSFERVILNVIETFYAIATWGQQAKSYERKLRRPLLVEQRFERNWFKLISEHKEVTRIVHEFDGGLLLLKPDISYATKTIYERYEFLWAENLFAVELERKPERFERIKEQLAQIQYTSHIGPIVVRLGPVIETVLRRLFDYYVVRIDEIVDFITTNELTLQRTLKDLDDIRMAMDCLQVVGEQFSFIDVDLTFIEQTYRTLAEFSELGITLENIETVYGIRDTFKAMTRRVEKVENEIIALQVPLQRELAKGVAKFNAEIDDFDAEFDTRGPLEEGIPPKEASDRLLIFQSRFDELWCRYEMYAAGEAFLGLKVNEYPVLQRRKKEFNLLNKLYSLYLEVMRSIETYYETPWREVDIESINAKLIDFENRCRKLPKAMKDWPAYLELKGKIDDFNRSCPLLELMCSEAMKDRHWDKLMDILGCKLDVTSPTFTLENIMAAPLLAHSEDIEDTCIGAVKENDIDTKLRSVVAEWSTVSLQFAPFKTRGELLIKPAETIEIIAQLEDSIMIVNSLASNRFNAHFKRDIMLWLNRLVNTGEILEKWLQVQNLWIYLEAVFVGGDISKQLPQDAKRFAGIDKSWVRIMYRARDNPNAIQCCTGEDVMSYTLGSLLEQLETCQKSLTGYLESKRLLFPRFFFISDPVLLEILGQASDPTSIQPHLLSIFDAVARVEFDPRTVGRIVGLCSANGERVELVNAVSCTGGVELWLGTLLGEMQDTMRTILATMAQLLTTPEFNFITGFQAFCGQAGLVGVQLLWTSEAELALARCRTDKHIMRTTNNRFLNLLNSLIELTVKDLTKLERIRFETMVTIHVHQRDIFDDLVRLRVRTALDFEWQKQARFYYDAETDDVIVKITDVDFIYQNEYLGVTERLAITPLTDRCYITLAQAIGMSMGGAPAGPAGTGKTETTKDMGRALGKLVVVFNCSDQMDFRGLGRIYKGLAQSGSWGCFDEFNRIELPVLSVAAQQIHIVLTARKEKRTSFLFSDGDTVSLNPEFGLFITMNPGYAGRQELPENLKIMFRSVAMMVPDRQIIMRVKLASCGFKDNVILARKFYTLYKLCEEQLSKQVHYDFGLRNILSVLRTLGAQKRANPTDTEETIVMRVLRDMNVSKLVDEDEPLFISLIEDLFPGIRLSGSSYKELQRAIALSADALGLVNHPEWNLKVIQLYETSLVRHGLMTLGPTGAGKTQCILTLLRSFTELGMTHKEVRMNPKAITAPQMFGRLDVATNDWTDGIFSTLWRRTFKVKRNEFVWLVLDGPVDAVWIENLNSVLDDNKTLTLANGDRITMAPNAKLVFEPDNVDNASPATVSRMGMVFMSASVMRWEAILNGWLKSKPPTVADLLRRLFHRIYHDLHEFVQTRLAAKMKLLEAIYIRQCCDLLEGLLAPADENGEKALSLQPPPPIDFSDAHLERLFLFSLIWSLGAVLELEDREKMGEFIARHPSKMKWPKLQPEETVFEYVVSREGTWQHWNERVEDYHYPSDSVPEFSSILVPNVDNVRSSFLIDLIARQRKAVLLIGEQGSGKTVMIKGYMLQYDPEYHLSKSLNFSSATTPNMFQRIVESYVEKRVGTTYGPPQQRRMSVFIDDINMPIVNEWGDQVTNEIVRQLMENRGFYSLDKPGDFLTVLDVQILAAMIHPGGGRNDIPPRLKRQFCIFNCAIPSNPSMDKIFGALGCGYFCEERFQSAVVGIVPRLVPLTRRLWQATKLKMLPTPAKFHYVFNLRDLSRIWEGMLKVQPDQCRTVQTMVNLWKHECTRVIADRFTSVEDRSWFLATLRTTAEQELGADAVQYLADEEHAEPFFVNFLRDAPEPTGEEGDDEGSLEPPKLYEQIVSLDETTQRVRMFLEQYNEQVRGATMDMVFFRDALIHLMIISRIIGTPRGNALLVGVGGSGKQSLARLASFIAGYRCYQITLTRAYNVTNLLEDLKYLYREAGQAGQGMTFLFTDNDIKDEGFLEYINNVLSSGEIANLFPKDELDQITNELIPVMKRVDPRRVPTQDNLYDFFIERARANLHIVLCFSPVGEKFRTRALKFPGLISGCTIDWFQRWPTDALVAVSSHFLRDYRVVCTDELKVRLIEIMAYVHNRVAEVCVEYYERFRRQAHVTPKSFLSFLDGYKRIYREKQEHIAVLAARMQTGLVKLIEAAQSVDVLRLELEEKEKDIVVATQAAEVVLTSVTESQRAAEQVKADVLLVKNRADALVSQIQADTLVAEEKLEAARPALEQAEAALKTVTAADIATVRKLGKPPYLITLIMDVVLLLFRRRLAPVRPDDERQFMFASWEQSLKVMTDTGFLGKIVRYQADLINAETVDLMVPYFRYHLYTFEAAKAACGNVAGLLKWTLAMADFYEVNKDVLPLKANLARQQKKLDIAMEEKGEAEAALLAKERELAVVQHQFDEAMAKKQAVLDDAKQCQDKMEAASALIGGLADERVRWTEQLEQFKDETERLVGDVLILTGFLSYTGPFNQEYRTGLQASWSAELNRRRIPVSRAVDITESLTDSATIGEWNLQGLPNDELSVQNGIIVTKATRYPLLIDPQSQGKMWIKSKEGDRGLIVSTLNHKYFRNHLEECISLGYPLLIEDIGEELDPVLDNVLERNFIKMGNTYKVRVGDKEVDVNPSFRLYLTTKLPNPLYTPEVSARTTIIDFTVTMRGLEDQLLGRVILTEKRELESERTQLIQGATANRRKMQELEANLLHKLSTTQGSLVDDVTVIGVLNTSKTTSIEVREKLAVARETEIKINRAREEFRPVAGRGSVLYFLICSMTMVDSMYQTSLVQFLERFDLSMVRSDRHPVPARRIANIIDYLTYDIFRYVCRGLYEVHKFLFVLLMALNIDLDRGAITHGEFQTFVKGGAALDINTCPEKPFKWIADVTWLNLVQLSQLSSFTSLLEQIRGNEKAWKAWFAKESPEEEPIPLATSGRGRTSMNARSSVATSGGLDAFRRLLLIRAWCPDRTLFQSRKYLASSLGARFADPVVIDYDAMLEESRPLTPLVCFLSMGSDPTPNIEALAKKNGIRCRAISMGQGQEVHARQLVEMSLGEGSWVLLQNCHLGLDYMNELLLQLIELERAGSAGCHAANFRLWLTTEPHPLFPITMLQLSIKFTNEPPSGVKAGLKRTYASMSLEMFEYSDSPLYVPLLFGISFLHTVVQERRKFGPLGWNIPYEFNSADWLASCMFVQNHLESLDPRRGISWKTMRYMLGEVQYGGRVTDDYDKRLLNTFARVWFSDALFDEAFRFYRDYRVMRFRTLEQYLEAIDEMPLVDPPQVYGLHANADITYQSNTTKVILDTILSIQPKESSGGGGETREATVARLVRDMLTKVPPPYDPYAVRERLRIMGHQESMNIFLRQEIDRIQRILLLVRQTLDDLLLAIDGVIIMNEQLRDALDNIYDARVPTVWKRGSWASASLGFWFTELIERNAQLHSWCFRRRPVMFWMTGFFNPQGFLTAMRQEVARAHKGWALDMITLHNDVTQMVAEDCKVAPVEGVYIYGLYLDGAGWDKRKVRLQEATNKILYSPMPVIHVYAINSTAAKDPKLYECPVYKKANRTDLNYITPLWLQTLKPPDHWIMRGVALLCDIK